MRFLCRVAIGLLASCAPPTPEIDAAASSDAGARAAEDGGSDAGGRADGELDAGAADGGATSDAGAVPWSRYERWSPPNLEAVNDLVGVQVYGGYYLYLLHFRQHSISADVAVGARLGAGHYLGRVGNSGVSRAPHLHLCVLTLDPASSPTRTWSVPSEWRDVYIGARRGTLASWTVPESGAYVADEPF